MAENANTPGRTAVRSLAGGIAGGCLGIVIGGLIASMLLGPGAPATKTGTPFDLLFGLLDMLSSGIHLLFALGAAVVGGLLGTLFGSTAGAIAGAAPASPALDDDQAVVEVQAHKAPTSAPAEIVYISEPIPQVPPPSELIEPPPTRWLGMCPACQSRCAISSEYVQGESIACPQCGQRVVMDFVAHVK